jgi:hypothetical protein
VPVFLLRIIFERNFVVNHSESTRLCHFERSKKCEAFSEAININYLRAKSKDCNLGLWSCHPERSERSATHIFISRFSSHAWRFTIYYSIIMLPYTEVILKLYWTYTEVILKIIVRQLWDTCDSIQRLLIQNLACNLFYSISRLTFDVSREESVADLIRYVPHMYHTHTVHIPHTYHTCISIYRFVLGMY